MEDRTFRRSPTQWLGVPACIAAVVAEVGFVLWIVWRHPRMPDALPGHWIRIKVQAVRYALSNLEAGVLCILTLICLIAVWVLIQRYQDWRGA